jgi:hypothetical protein
VTRPAEEKGGQNLPSPSLFLSSPESTGKPVACKKIVACKKMPAE